ncbi:MAG: spore maturation protein [Rhodospirillales bacterium]|nr:spore maturation protein [Rhodospirillales bacterium]
MNVIFPLLVLSAFALGAVRQLGLWGSDAGTMERLAKAIVDDAGQSVVLAIGLAGMMALFLGLMKIAEAGGLLHLVARLLRAPMIRLFPSVPPAHPAMGAMILNIGSNVLGLGNAATPFGIRAMQHLDALNPLKGTATNAMVLFLAINTSSVTLLPTTVIALRAAAGSADPAGIIPTTLFATLCSTAVAISLAKACETFSPVAGGSLPTPPLLSSSPAPALGAPGPSVACSEEEASAPQAAATPAALSPWVSGLLVAAVLGVIPAMLIWGAVIGPWIIPALVAGLVTFGAVRRVRVYEAFIEGAGDGFQIAVRIIPYLIAILVAVGMLRASGLLDLVIQPIGVITAPFGLPAEGLLMGLLRALSGSGAFAYLASLLNDPAIGPDSYTGYLVSTIQGSTETTFYVLAVYFGAVGVQRMRHAVFVGIAADAAGVAASVLICSLLHGG